MSASYFDQQVEAEIASASRHIRVFKGLRDVLLEQRKRLTISEEGLKAFQEATGCASAKQYMSAQALKGKHKHMCPDWDYLWIDENCPEFKGCSCSFPKLVS